MEQGWIKLHRKFTEWEWYKKPNTAFLFMHFLLLANHEEKKWQGQSIKEGQFITGRKSLSEQTGLPEQIIRTCITRLKSTNEITTKSTNKYTLITIIKWALYQGYIEKSTKKTTDKQPTTNQQLTTNKNDKNEKNTLSEASDDFNFYEEINKLRSSSRKDLKIIALYWSEKGFKFENREQFNAALKRELRPAKALLGYTSVQIRASIYHCKDKFPDLWTLETVGKRIIEIVNKS